MIDIPGLDHLESIADHELALHPTAGDYVRNAARALRELQACTAARHVDLAMTEILQGRDGTRIACPCCGFVVGSLQENHDTNG